MAWKRLGSQIVAQANDAEVMLADLHQGMYYTIAGSGAEMWNAIDCGYSREQIVRQLESVYEASPQALADALTEFVDSLVDYDLIKPSGALVEPENRPQAAVKEKRVFVAPVVSRFKRSDPELVEKCKGINWQPATTQLAWTSQDQGVTIVQVEQGVKYELTGTAKDIWLGLSSGYSRKLLIEALTSRFPSSAGQVVADSDKFITELVQSGLLQPATNEPTRVAAPVQPDRQIWEAPHMVATEDKTGALRWVSEFIGWEPSAPRIVAEAIESEVIIVDLKAGIYHSITGAGAVIWQALSIGQLRDQIVSSLQDYFDVSVDKAQAEIDDVLGKLSEHALIRPRSDDTNSRSNVKLPLPVQKEPFVKSQLSSFRDMEDVLRLDPVHDFDEYGWPNKA